MCCTRVAHVAPVLRTLFVCRTVVSLFVAHVFGICKFILPMASVRCASVVRVLYLCCAYAGHIVCNYCAFGPPMLCICCPALRAYVVYVVFLLRFCCCVLRAYVQCYFFAGLLCVCVCVLLPCVWVSVSVLGICCAYYDTMCICCNVVVHLDCMHNVGMCSVHVAHIYIYI